MEKKKRNAITQGVPTFVGRRTELAQLEKLLKQAARGQGSVVLVEGEAGIGKTTLVNQFFHETSQEMPMLITATGKCTAISGHGDAFLPFRQVLRQIAISEDKDDTLTRSRHFDFVTKVAPAWISVIPGIGAFIAALIQSGVEAHEIYLQKPQTIPREQMFEQFSQVLQHLGKKNVLALFIDDLQWADSASVSLLFHIARNISTYRLLLICAYRPSDVEVGMGERYSTLKDTLYEMQRYGLCTELFVGQLTKDQVREMVNLEFPGNRFPAEFIPILYKRSGGNALFVTNFLSLLKDQDAVGRDEIGWYLTKSLASLEIPSQIEGVLRKRLERLTEELRDFCDCASIEGTDFTYEIVAKVLKQEFKRGDVEIGKQVRLLQNVHRLIQEKGEKRLSSAQVLLIYSFAHGLLQEILYHDLSPGLRQQYHNLIGEALEQLYVDDLEEIAPQLAIHFKHGKQFGKAAEYFYVAGMAAHRLSATAETAYNFQNGVVLLEALPKRKRNLPLLADCYQTLAHTHSLLMGQFNKGITLYEQCIRIREHLPDQEGHVLECLHMTGVCYRGLEQFDRAREYYEQALPLAIRLGKHAKQGNILRDIGTTYYLEGDLDTSFDYFQQSLELLSDSQDEGGVADTLRRLGNVHRDKGELERARELYSKALEIHKRLKRFIHEMMIYEEMSALAFHEGKDQEGFILAEAAREIGEKHSFYHRLSGLLRFVARRYLERRQFSQAFHTYTEAAIVSHKCNPHEYRKTIAALLEQVEDLHRRGRSHIANQFCDVLIASWRDQDLDHKVPEFISLWQQVKHYLQATPQDTDWADFVANLISSSKS
ncbi:MAG: AAA family ATPase [Chloroflexi bacterium]|nr:AAA family ATPase [Chloroflexota bacterium]